MICLAHKISDRPGKPVPLMQLILSDEQSVRLTGGNHGTLDTFAEALGATLADTPTVFCCPM
uniref:Uncharacterized protein n=1 Tax=blood disease bacterium R229 TaxID=741978 RepID=G2ZWC8_9RALS|nr:hypothetical protein BDB_mp60589 [blood disease bacterium R229]